ncbi:MAG: hypothetical protein ACRD6W_06350, partial [Nitrososphaerales archaeon]
MASIGVDTAKRMEGPKGRGPALSAFALACMGTALVGLGYSLGRVSPNIDELVGPAVFWFATVFFLLSVPFREAVRTFSKSIR